MRLESRFSVDDRELSALHNRTFGGAGQADTDWSRRLNQHALAWIGAFDQDQLVGFIQVCWDGGSHAFLLDTIVDPDWQRQGIGTALVQKATAEAKAAGCEWLHVDFEDDLVQFYFEKCGFKPTMVGVLNLLSEDVG